MCFICKCVLFVMNDHGISCYGHKRCYFDTLFNILKYKMYKQHNETVLV